MPWHIIIADDHPVVLAGMSAVLQSDDRLDAKIIIEASNADEILDGLKNHPCDVLITDFNMPGSQLVDGLELISYLRRHFPNVKIIVITTLQNPGLVTAMLKKGADGIFDKREKLHFLKDAVNTVMSGKTFLSSNLHDVFTDAMSNADEIALTLTNRELEVLRMYANGFNGREIAEHLKRSEKTISRQKRDAMRKLGILHDSQLREAAKQLGLL